MDLSYPIGKFAPPDAVGPDERRKWIDILAAAPARLRAAVDGLTASQLDTPYRPNGWTVRQVVHHLADSHMHSYIRYRLALTEENPTIKPYDQEKWAELPDAHSGPVETSLVVLEGMHSRWVALLQSMSAADFERTFFHPERGQVRLDATLALYAWHCRHHESHITGLRKRMGWS
jgi:hypothetical protein